MLIFLHVANPTSLTHLTDLTSDCRTGFFFGIFTIDKCLFVLGMIKLILRLKREDSGRFFDYKGDEISW